MSARKMIQEEFVEEQTNDGELEVTAVAAPDMAANDQAEPAARKNGNGTSNGNGNGSARPKADQAFDPTQYLSKFDGRDYLEVKWRVMWVRHEHPDARRTTEIVQH